MGSLLRAGRFTALATLAAAVLAVETLAGFALLTALTARLILFLLGALFARKGRFDGKADALVLGVDFENLDIDNVADLQGILHLLEAAVGDVGDVDQTVKAGFQFDERAERHDADDTALDHSAGGVLLDRRLPRMRLRLLVTEADALLLAVKRQNDDFDFVAGLDNIGGMLHAAPGQIVDVDQTVNAADIDERAEVGQALHGALNAHADFQLLPNMLLGFLGLGLEDFLAGSDDAALGAIELDDLQLEFLTDIGLHVLNIAHGKMRSGDERADAVGVGDQAALDDFLDGGGDQTTLFVGVDDVAPVLLGVDVLLGKNDIALAVVDFNDFDFDLVADFQKRRRDRALPSAENSLRETKPSDL